MTWSAEPNCTWPCIPYHSVEWAGVSSSVYHNDHICEYPCINVHDYCRDVIPVKPEWGLNGTSSAIVFFYTTIFIAAVIYHIYVTGHDRSSALLMTFFTSTCIYALSAGLSNQHDPDPGWYYLLTTAAVFSGVAFAATLVIHCGGGGGLYSRIRTVEGVDAPSRARGARNPPSYQQILST